VTRIVLVDDDRDILDTTSELLRIYGYEVTAVQQAAGALEVLRRVRPDLLLQDCAMPGLDLDGLVRQIRSDAGLQDLAIILFTGSVNAKTTAQRTHVEGFVEKPFDFEQLRKRIEQTVAKKAASSLVPRRQA
jgi:CheY-like chemotaxis protein